MQANLRLMGSSLDGNECGEGCGPEHGASPLIAIGRLGSECARRLKTRSSAGSGRPFRALIVGARGLRGGFRWCRFTLIAETGRVRHFRALPETRLFSRHPNWDWRPIFVHLKWD